MRCQHDFHHRDVVTARTASFKQVELQSGYYKLKVERSPSQLSKSARQRGLSARNCVTELMANPASRCSLSDGWWYPVFNTCGPSTSALRWSSRHCDSLWRQDEHATFFLLGRPGGELPDCPLAEQVTRVKPPFLPSLLFLPPPPFANSLPSNSQHT
ncbi:uncharacterized protein BKA78DRAFT_89385 [Phyllosticta capitalensis]|uniref:uncharacterized protein n=1 Tax=Phyllosticta capitalensis TaxID=121624 RepID=UPI003132303C